MFIIYTSAPRMSIDGEEVTSDNLIDNDLTTCELLPVGDGCRMDKVKFTLTGRRGSRLILSIKRCDTFGTMIKFDRSMYKRAFSDSMGLFVHLHLTNHFC